MLNLLAKVKRRRTHVAITDPGRPRPAPVLRCDRCAYRLFLRRQKKAQTRQRLGSHSGRLSLGFSLSFKDKQMNNNSAPILGPSAYLVKDESDRWPINLCEAMRLLSETIVELRRHGRAKRAMSDIRRGALNRLETIADGRRSTRVYKSFRERMNEAVWEYVDSSVARRMAVREKHESALANLRRVQIQLGKMYVCKLK